MGLTEAHKIIQCLSKTLREFQIPSHKSMTGINASGISDYLRYHAHIPPPNPTQNSSHKEGCEPSRPDNFPNGKMMSNTHLDDTFQCGQGNI